MECNLSEIRIRVISKSNKHTVLVWFWNHKYDFSQKLHDPKFDCHFITSILKSHNLIVKYKNYKILVSIIIIYWISSRFNLVPRVSHLSSFAPGGRWDERPWERGCSRFVNNGTGNAFTSKNMSTWTNVMWLRHVIGLFYCLILIGWEKDAI